MGYQYYFWHAYKLILVTVCGMGIMLHSGTASAVSYGVYDARSMAMAGTGVASANSANAIFFNPSLYAIYDVIKEEGDNQRFHFPLLALRASDAAESLADIQDDDLDARLTNTINAFNAAATSANASAVTGVARDFEEALRDIANEDLVADGFAGLAIGVPGKWEGGGFFVGSRLVGGGVGDITNEDVSLLNAYVEGLTFIATGGSQGSPQPQIFDTAGNLVDPVSQLTSTARARGIVFSEVGVAMSKEFKLFGRYIALGIAPKFSYISVFEYNENITANGISIGDSREDYDRLNLDVGATTKIGDTYRIGLAVKNLVPLDLGSELGGKVKLRPQVRAGLAWQAGELLVALDLDLLPNEPVGFEEKTQELALGVEWSVREWAWLRGGYRLNLEGDTGDLVSLGAGTVYKRFLFDVAYGLGSDDQAAAIQLGMAF